MHNDLIVRSIDVGFGNTKFVVLSANGDIQCSLFPSLAPQASEGADLGTGVLQKRNTVTVEVGGVKYEVGKDAQLAQDATHGRVLDLSYPTTDPYLALVRGAIYYMGVPEIHLLVLGLPVNSFDKYKDVLEKRVVGEHRIPNPLYKAGGGNPEYISVKVHNVKVQPQPLGAFFDHAVNSGVYSRMRNEMNLLIDAGFYTLDWIVSHGVKMVNARSGAHSGGMSSILSTMGESIGKKIGGQITDLTVLDEAIRTGNNPRFYGKEFDITEQRKMAKAKAEQFVSVLANKVGQSVDIDNIILAGGGATFFKDVIKAKFPHHDIIVTKNPVFANVRGFQLVGEQSVARLNGI